MSLTYTADFKGQNNGVSAAITSNTLTVATGDYITVAVATGDQGKVTAWAISNTGTAITWTQRKTIGAGANCEIWLFDGVAGATPPTTVTATATAGPTQTIGKCIGVLAHTGAHATTPLPAGNIFTGSATTDVSQSITPTSSGSALWMICADWAATNTFAAGANCSIQGSAFHEAGQETFALFRPTTQPRTDAAAFTISETDTAGTISYIAWEVQAEPAPPPSQNSLTARVVRRVGV